MEPSRSAIWSSAFGLPLPADPWQAALPLFTSPQARRSSLALAPATHSSEGPSLPAPSRTAGSLWRAIKRAEDQGWDWLRGGRPSDLPRGQDRLVQAQRFGCRDRGEDSRAPGIRFITRLCVGPRWRDAEARQASRSLLQLLAEPRVCAGLPEQIGQDAARQPLRDSSLRLRLGPDRLGSRWLPCRVNGSGREPAIIEACGRADPRRAAPEQQLVCPAVSLVRGAVPCRDCER